MIGYAPLDSGTPPKRSAPLPVQMKIPEKYTECNYLVMFFIVGVLGLAIKDMARR
jgi:hypothetical protein